MKFITQINDLAGKTIKQAVYVDWDERIFMSFTDNSYALICTDAEDEEVSLYTEAILTNDVKVQLGIISQEEVDRQRDEKRAIDRHAQKDRDLRTLASLKAQYES